MLKLIVDTSLGCLFYRKVCKVAGGAKKQQQKNKKKQTNNNNNKFDHIYIYILAGHSLLKLLNSLYAACLNLKIDSQCMCDKIATFLLLSFCKLETGSGLKLVNY